MFTSPCCIAFSPLQSEIYLVGLILITQEDMLLFYGGGGCNYYLA